jgi:hypothetical protein
MQIFFSTVARNAPIEKGGELVKLDWDSKKIRSKIPVAPTNPSIYDPNPRGNARGGRGIAIIGSQVVVATYHTLKVFDLQLNPVRDFSHNLMVGMHETFHTGENTLWVTSTAIDAAIAYDLHAEKCVAQYWPREMPGLQKQLNLSPLEIDKAVDNRLRFLDTRIHRRKVSHLHFNAITQWNAEMYGLFNAKGAVVNLDQDTVVIQDKALVRGLKLMIEESGMAVVNDTFGRAVQFYDIRTGQLKRDVKLSDFQPVKKLLHWKDEFRYSLQERLKPYRLSRLFPAARPLFVRGMDKVGTRLFIGVSPASILCLDWETGKLLDVFTYSQDVRVAVHGLKAWIG